MSYRGGGKASTTTASRYRHAVGKPGKRESYYATGTLGTTHDASNGLAMSKHWLAYRGASGISLLDLHRSGTESVTLPIANSTDMDFSPFDDDLLAVGAEDGGVSVWHVPSEQRVPSENGIVNTTVSKVHAVQPLAKRIESVLFHPTARNLLCAASGTEIHIADVERVSEFANYSLTLTGHTDTVQSYSWRESGSLVASTARDGLLRLWDPRASSSKPMSTGKCHHPGSKTSRVLWLGNRDLVFTTGFTQTRQREYAMFDIRGDLSKPVVRQQLESSSSALVPLYDQDTEVLYLIGRGDTSVRWFETADAIPNLVDGPPTMGIPSSISGMILAPKRCLNIMDGEIARVLCLTANDGIVPVSFQVPRKSYRDFHADLFPDTKGDKAASLAKDWLKAEGGESFVERVSLEPSKGNLVYSQLKAAPAAPIVDVVAEAIHTTTIDDVISATESSLPDAHPSSTTKTESTTSPSRFANIVRQSSYRHLSGQPLHPREHFEDLRNLSYSLSGESNVLESNRKYLAFPLTGAGGRVGVVCADRPGRIPAVLPAVVNGSVINDFALSKLQPSLMCTGGEDGKLRVWHIPDGGLTSDLDQPAAVLSGHTNRINMCQFHPYAADVALTASPEQGSATATIRLWDLEAQREARKLDGFGDGILGCAWSTDGSGRLVVSCKDKRLRLFDKRSQHCISEGPSHKNPRACRVLWASHDRLITVGFGKGSQREVCVYDSNNLGAGAMFTLALDGVSPSVLVPHFDDDCKILYLAGRGDTGILPIEVTLSDATTPLHVLPRFDAPKGTIQQGVAFVAKRQLDVRSVEVARCWRLTQTAIEPISWTVPRNRKDLFQDDLYPLSRDFEAATMTSGDFFGGHVDVAPVTSVNLQPGDMKKLSDAPAAPKAESKYVLPTGEPILSASQLQAKFVGSMFAQAKADEGPAQDAPLPQDLKEGVDSDEWDD